MGKPKNTKIATRIRWYVILICAFALASISTLAYLVVKKSISYALTSNMELADNARKDAENAILFHTRHFLQIIAKEQAKNCDSVLRGIQHSVLLFEGAVSDILSHPDHYLQKRPIISQKDLTPGTYSNTWLLPSAVPVSPSIDKEIVMMSNLRMVTPALLSHPDVVEVYAGLASGLFYAYSPRRINDPASYDPRLRPWYAKALEHPKDTVITDAYEDAFGKGMVITSSKAVLDETGKILGVVALDVSLQQLTRSILETQITQSGYAFIVDSTGRYVVHPDLGKEGFKPFLQENQDQAFFQDVYQRMMNHEAGFVEGEINGEAFYVTFSPISVTGWSVGVIVSKNEVLESLRTFAGRIESFIAKSEKNVITISDNAIYIFSGVSLLVAGMVIMLAVSISYFLTKPITNLIAEVEKINKSNLQYKIPIQSNDEIGMLTETFNRMTNRLYEYTVNILELNSTKKQLETEAHTDALTHIANRRYFMTIAALELERALVSQLSSFIVFFDIDHFKQVNDTYGHALGDETLKSIAARVKDTIRPDDVFARFGGEEFIILVSGVDKKNICALTERIRLRIGSVPVGLDDLSFSVSASFGIAPAAPENDLQTAIKLADEALYCAKEAGRDKVVFWPSETISAPQDGAEIGDQG